MPVTLHELLKELQPSFDDPIALRFCEIIDTFPCNWDSRDMTMFHYFKISLTNGNTVGIRKCDGKLEFMEL